MFNLFSKKPTYKITDLIWISDAAKVQGCVKELHEKKYDYIVAWFPETLRRFDSIFKENGISNRISKVSELQLRDMQGQKILMLEHYPLFSVETELFSTWGAADISIVSSLDEAWLKQFGADNIRGLMQKMGMKEDEVLSHSMITSSIQNAQKKLDQKVSTEMKANSMDEWFRINIRE